MFNKGTIFYSIDNSGILQVKCIQIYSKKNWGCLGDLILAVVQKSFFNKRLKKSKFVEPGSLVKVFVVQLKNKYKRSDGFCIYFDNNGIVNLNKQMLPAGSRLLGPVALELNFDFVSKKFLTMAPAVI